MLEKKIQAIPTKQDRSVSPFTFSQILQSQARFRHEMLTTFLAYFSDVLFKFVAI